MDIFVANGHVYPGVDKQVWGTTWAQRPLLLRNLDGSKFAEVPAATGSGLAVVVSARGAAFGDLFNDGHINVVLNDMDSTPTLLIDNMRLLLCSKIRFVKFSVCPTWNRRDVLLRRMYEKKSIAV